MRSSQDIGHGFEKTLEGVFSSLQDLYAFRYHKFVDTHAAGNIVASQPSDYLVASKGQMFFVEAKASTRNKRMQRSALRPAQRGAIQIYGQVLGIPYYILHFSEQDGLVHLLNGAEFMKGSRTNYDNSVIQIAETHDLESMLVREWELTGLATTLKKFHTKYGDEA